MVILINLKQLCTKKITHNTSNTSIIMSKKTSVEINLNKLLYYIATITTSPTTLDDIVEYARTRQYSLNTKKTYEDYLTAVINNKHLARQTLYKIAEFTDVFVRWKMSNTNAQTALLYKQSKEETDLKVLTDLLKKDNKSIGLIIAGRIFNNEISIESDQLQVTYDFINALLEVLPREMVTPVKNYMKIV